MSFTPLSDLTTPATSEEVKAKIYEVLAVIGVTTTTWKPGAVVRTMIAATSIVLAAFSRLQALIARSGFLELSSGPWLALVAKYVYGEDKRYATFAEGSETLINSGGGVYVLDVDDLILQNPETGKTYRNTEAITLGALATITITIRATEAGAASTSAPGAISTISTPPLVGVTCTNALAVIGLDDEEDPALRVRCAEKLGSLSPFGPWDAYGFAARNARRLDGSSVGVTRVRTSKDGYGNVFLYVATASGAVTGTVEQLDTDLGVVDDAIQKLAAPLAVRGVTRSATNVVVPVTYRAWAYNTSGLTEDEITAAIEKRLVSFMPAQPIGGNVIEGVGRLYVDALRTTIGAALPQLFHVELISPAADVVLTLDQVPVLGAITPVAITQVAPSEGVL